MLVTAITIFLGAFLLFLVQPLTARRLLPWFGGSAAVWIVSLLFFQTALLAGYVYAHALATRVRRARQPWLHAALLAGALAFLPIGPRAPEAPPAGDPAAAILLMLVTSLGLPLLLLASTSPLLQSWLATSSGLSDRVYRLFAVSNLGSLLGLWCYPFLLEPFTSVEAQVRLWSSGFALYAVVSWVGAFRARRGLPAATESRRTESRIPLPTRALWLGLSATGAVMLLATTNQLTRNVASFPFLWVLPLSLYLLSFIVAFERDRWYQRGPWSVVYLVSLAAVLHLLAQEDEPDLLLQLGAYGVNLLAGCMICHGELARLRPGTASLTRFYLHVAFGGALGGAAVSLVAPALFRGYWEYPLGLFAVYVLGGVAMLFGSERDASEWETLRARAFWAVGAIALAVLLGVHVRSESRGVTYMKRSFFGVLRIYDSGPGTRYWERYLWNGPVSHGGQLMTPERRKTPILYYGPETGVGLALGYEGPPWDVRGRRVGVVGLGTGSVAAWARPGDHFRFYEINPDVVEVAREYFYYLEDSAAEVSIALGDARLSLASELETGAFEPFDILVIDAFSGDAIPVHLLTEEAFALYDACLSPEGILVVHVSNLHFDLRPVVRAQAERLGAVPLLVETNADPDRNLYVTDWVLVTRNPSFLASPDVQGQSTPWRADEPFDPEEHLWTDDYANLLRALRAQ